MITKYLNMQYIYENLHFTYEALYKIILQQSFYGYNQADVTKFQINDILLDLSINKYNNLDPQISNNNGDYMVLMISKDSISAENVTKYMICMQDKYYSWVNVTLDFPLLYSVEEGKIYVGQTKDSLPLDCKYIVINQYINSIIIEHNEKKGIWQQFQVPWSMNCDSMVSYVQLLVQPFQKQQIIIQQFQKIEQLQITAIKTLQLELAKKTKQLNIPKKQKQNYQQEAQQQERIYQVLLVISALVILLLIISTIRGCDCYEKSQIQQ